MSPDRRAAGHHPGLAGALITIFGGYQVTFIAGIVFVLLGIVAIIPIRSVR